VLRLALRQLLGRRTSTALAAAGLLVATLGFLTLVGTAETTQAALRGDITRTWDTPYDLLVRPAGSVTQLEASQGLVRPNFVSGLSRGGITPAQVEAVRRVQGVRVAAPVAIVGTTNWLIGGFGVDLAGENGQAPLAVYRVRIDSTTDGGLSTGTVATHHVIVAREGTVTYAEGSRDATLRLRGRSIPCPQDTVQCYAPRVCEHGTCGPPPDPPGWGVELLQPIVVAGVDPAAEAELAGLDHCLTSGRYLGDDDHLRRDDERDPPGVSVPALVSDRSFVDETLGAELSVAADPGGLLRGTAPGRLGGWRTVRRDRTTIDERYRAYLARLGQEADEWPVWSVGDVAYTQRGATLAARTRDPDPSIYERENYRPVNAGTLVPPAARDRWFRSVTQHGYRRLEGNRYWDAVGTYDPGCLPGFDRLAGGGLETYSTPGVRLPGGRELRPDRSPAGYVNSPPLVLTSLEAASWFADPAHFAGGPGASFVSVIRVRADGVATAGEIAQARLARVAAAIRDATGLQVDIVKGASPKGLAVELPAGSFGRPALTVTEPWSVKGVALRFTRAVSAQNVGLFALALVGATILVGTTAYISVRRRRREFGVLRALGWPSRRIAWLVELEMLALGGAVGCVALAAGLPLAAFAGTGTLAWTVAATVPLALAVAGLAALGPALSAARGTTATVLAPRSRVRRSRPPRSATTLGLRDLAGLWRVEALLGAGAIALGAAMLGGVVLVVTAFGGQLDATFLGLYLAGRVRPFHVVVAVLTLVIGALAAGQVVTLGYLERAPQLAALRALGWPRRQVLRLLAAQGLALGLAGGLAGAGAVWGIAAWIGAGPGATARAALAAAGAALLATGLAVAGPLASAAGTRPADTLRGE
jgi:hypothetical protein